MKIELKDGTMIHLESAAELAEALKVVGGQQIAAQPERKKLDLEAELVDEGQRVRAVFTSVNTNARKFMAALLPYKKGISGEKFEEVSGFSSDKFGGTMGGVKKCAANQKLKREQFIMSEQKMQGTGRVRVLAPGPLLLKYEFDLRKLLTQKGEIDAIPAVSVGA